MFWGIFPNNSSCLLGKLQPPNRVVIQTSDVLSCICMRFSFTVQRHLGPSQTLKSMKCHFIYTASVRINTGASPRLCAVWYLAQIGKGENLRLVRPPCGVRGNVVRLHLPLQEKISGRSFILDIAASQQVGTEVTRFKVWADFLRRISENQLQALICST